MRSVLVRGGRGFRALTLLVVFAFSLQSFVTQTHIHGVASAEPGIVKLIKHPAQNPSPADSSDSSSCAFCQAVAHSAVFFAPAAPLLLPPAAWFIPALLPASLLAGNHAVAHGWQSRAPPKA